MSLNFIVIFVIALAFVVLWWRYGIFEPRDLWVGVFWHITTEWHPVYSAMRWNLKISISGGAEVLLIYICVIPTLPIRLKFRLANSKKEK